MTNEQYNGWTNYETWLFNLHYGDEIDPEGYDETSLREYLSDLFDELNPIPETPSFWTDLIQGAKSEINFDEIARNILAD